MDINILDFFPIVLFFISFFGLITSKNVIKTIVFILLLQTAVIMFWLGLGARYGIMPPIIYDAAHLDNLYAIADPLPQALMITAIIIGISVTAVNLVMLNTLIRKYNTSEWKTLRDLARKDEDKDS